MLSNCQEGIGGMNRAGRAEHKETPPSLQEGGLTTIQNQIAGGDLRQG